MECDARVWEAVILYEDGYASEAQAIFDALTEADRAVFREEAAIVDAKRMRTEERAPAARPARINREAAFFEDKILAADERDASRWG